MLAFRPLSVASFFDGGDGKDVTVKNKETVEKEKIEVTYKEACYLELYADVDKHKVQFAKEIKIQDKYGKDVFFFDSFKKDENDIEYYVKSYCYKDLKIDKQHTKTTTEDKLDAETPSDVVKDNQTNLDELSKSKDNKASEDAKNGNTDLNALSKSKDNKASENAKSNGYRLRRRAFDSSLEDGLSFNDYGKGLNELDFGLDDDKDKDKKVKEEQEKKKKQYVKEQQFSNHDENNEEKHYDSREDADKEKKEHGV
ncbi:hypothetical protein JCM8547_007228 [Rhodosporidiobolus lusitaniae]